MQLASLGATPCSNALQTDTHALSLCCTGRRRLLTAADASHGSGNRKLLMAPSGSLSSSMAPEPVLTDITMPSTLRMWGPQGAPGPLPVPEMAALSPEGQAVTQGEVNNDGVDVVAAARFSYGSAYPDLGEFSAVEGRPAEWAQAVRCMPPVSSAWGLRQTPQIGPRPLLSTVPVALCGRPAGYLRKAVKWAVAAPCMHLAHCALSHLQWVSSWRALPASSGA